jgi:hypothetical protein
MGVIRPSGFADRQRLVSDNPTFEELLDFGTWVHDETFGPMRPAAEFPTADYDEKICSMFAPSSPRPITGSDAD